MLSANGVRLNIRQFRSKNLIRNELVPRTSSDFGVIERVCARIGPQATAPPSTTTISRVTAAAPLAWVQFNSF
jgi:hypothetical protein